MNKSESIKELAEALSKVKFGQITKSKSVKVAMKTGGAYSFQYAPLEDIMSAIRRPLGEQGLSLSQSVEPHGEGWVVETVLMHQSGEWKLGIMPVVIRPGMTSQEFSSSVSYSRRYGITLICCLVADEDDDANIADGNEVKAEKPKAKAFETAHKPTDGEFDALSLDQQTIVHDLSNRVRSMGIKDIKGCCDEVDETLAPYENVNDMKIALWAKLQDLSTVRNAMKAHWASRKTAELENQNKALYRTKTEFLIPKEKV
jgi:hypothetical protein